MDAASLLQTISEYCRRAGLAESTFGRLVLNDGKFVGRVRDGGRIRGDTLRRIEAYLDANPAEHRRSRHRQGMGNGDGAVDGPAGPLFARDTLWNGSAPVEFHFYDNRQKYLLFINTCSEKWVIGERVASELARLDPQPPAVRMFDAGVGDGTVLGRAMRAMHQRYPTLPFYIVGKEVSMEGVRLALDKMPDRFFEHPATVLILTNLHYAEAPWLTPSEQGSASGLNWHELALAGRTADEFEEQITELWPWLVENWRARINPRTGRLGYERPTVLVVYREDHRFALDAVVPRRGTIRAAYDFILASQPYRARASLDFKARQVLAPLARALGPGGRLLGIHSYGHDPGVEILQAVWPGENPFQHDRHAILNAVKAALGAEARRFDFNSNSDELSIFRYTMHTLPHEIAASVGTSTLLAAWNAAVYVGQIDDGRLQAVMGDRRYIDAVRGVLQKHDGLWFLDESYVISRRRGRRGGMDDAQDGQ